MSNNLNKSKLQLIFSNRGEPDNILFQATEQTQFRELLLQLPPLITKEWNGVPASDPDSGFSSLRLFVSPEKNLEDVQKLLNAKNRSPTSLNKAMSLHSLLLRGLRNNTRVLKCLSTHAPYLHAPGIVITIVLRTLASITWKEIQTLYPKPYSALQVFRTEGNFTKVDIKENLRSRGCPSEREASPSSLVRDKLWNKASIVPFRIHLALSRGVTSGPRYMIMDQFHLNQLRRAKSWFEIDVVSEEPDDLDFFRIKTLTCKLLRVYERADAYASDSTISSSAKGSLLLPILNDIFSDRARFQDDQVTRENEVEVECDDESEDDSDDELDKYDRCVEQGKAAGPGRKRNNEGGDPRLEDYFVFRVKEDQAGFTFTLKSPSKTEKLVHITFRPDSMIVFHGVPVIFCEIDSNNSSADHFRMIGQACGINRLLNMYGITAGDTDEVITIAIYLDKSMVVTVRILSSKYDPTHTAKAENIPIHQEKIKFYLCSREKTVEGNERTKKIPSQTVKLVKFLHDTRRFLDEMYPKEKRAQFSEVIQAANDFSVMVRGCVDSTSASKAAESSRASKAQSKTEALNKPSGNVTVRSGSASGSRARLRSASRMHGSVPEDRAI